MRSNSIFSSDRQHKCHNNLSPCFILLAEKFRSFNVSQLIITSVRLAMFIGINLKRNTPRSRCYCGVGTCTVHVSSSYLMGPSNSVSGCCLRIAALSPHFLSCLVAPAPTVVQGGRLFINTFFNLIAIAADIDLGHRPSIFCCSGAGRGRFVFANGARLYRQRLHQLNDAYCFFLFKCFGSCIFVSA